MRGGFGLVGARSYKYDVEFEDTEGKIRGKPGMTFVETKLGSTMRDRGRR